MLVYVDFHMFHPNKPRKGVHYSKETNKNNEYLFVLKKKSIIQKKRKLDSVGNSGKSKADLTKVKNDKVKLPTDVLKTTYADIVRKG